MASCAIAKPVKALLDGFKRDLRVKTVSGCNSFYRASGWQPVFAIWQLVASHLDMLSERENER